MSIIYYDKDNENSGKFEIRLGCLGVRDRFPVEEKKYSFSPMNISELCYLKCDFEHLRSRVISRRFNREIVTASELC